LNKFEKIIGSSFLFGFIPFAPGTFGSIPAILFLFIPGFNNIIFLIPLILLTFIYGIFLADKFESQFGKDPKQCTIDEMLGTWISFIFIPFSLINYIITFILWRFFDIIKPYPIKQIEKIKGGLGIMLDDVLAGIYTLIISHIIIYFINQ